MGVELSCTGCNGPARVGAQYSFATERYFKAVTRTLSEVCYCDNTDKHIKQRKVMFEKWLGAGGERYDIGGGGGEGGGDPYNNDSLLPPPPLPDGSSSGYPPPPFISAPSPPLLESHEEPPTGPGGRGAGLGLGPNGQTLDMLTVADLLKASVETLRLDSVMLKGKVAPFVRAAYAACRATGTTGFKLPARRPEGLTPWEFRLFLIYVGSYLNILVDAIRSQPGSDEVTCANGAGDERRQISLPEFNRYCTAVQLRWGLCISDPTKAFKALLESTRASHPLLYRREGEGTIPFVAFYQWLIGQHFEILGLQRVA